MNLLDTISIIGEMIAWAGLSFGLFCLLLAKQYKRKKAAAVYLDAFVFSERNASLIRWMAPDGMHERPLTHAERRAMEHGWHTVLVDSRTYRKLMHRDPQEPWEIFSMLAKFLLGAGVLGFALSWLSIFD